MADPGFLGGLSASSLVSKAVAARRTMRGRPSMWMASGGGADTAGAPGLQSRTVMPRDLHTIRSRHSSRLGRARDAAAACRSPGTLVAGAKVDIGVEGRGLIVGPRTRSRSSLEEARGDAGRDRASRYRRLSMVRSSASRQRTCSSASWGGLARQPRSRCRPWARTGRGTCGTIGMHRGGCYSSA